MTKFHRFKCRSLRGMCDRLRTACLIVKNSRLVGAGYNGSVSGAPHCDDVGHLMIDGHCERTLHGEENAILNTRREDMRGAFAYILGTPCIRCAKLLANAGVKEAHYLGSYGNSRGREYLAQLSVESGMLFVQHELDPKQLLDEAVSRLKVASLFFATVDYFFNQFP